MYAIFEITFLMGIKGLLPWLLSTFKSAVSYVKTAPTDILFIDSNQLFYYVLTNHNFILCEEVFIEFTELLDKVIEGYPSKLVFIGTDGPVPLAKATAQRARRYQSDTYSPFIAPKNVVFNSIFIEANSRLKMHFQNRPNIIFALSTTPGESEHQFLAYLRSEMRKPNWIEPSISILSNDGDLVFLMLILPITDVTIIRFQGVPFIDNIYLSISEIKRLLASEFNYKGDMKKVYNDITFLSFLCSNDMIPCFPDIPGNPSSLSTLLKFYHNLDGFITDGKHIDRKGLFKFLEIFKPLKQFKNQYTKEMCLASLRTLEWIQQYYHSGVPDWSWIYPYSYCPPFSALAQSVKQFDAEFSCDQPIPDFLFCRLSSSTVYNQTELPNAFYQAKLRYPLNKFFPVAPLNVQDIPIVEYDILRKIYLELMPTIPEDIKEKTKITPFYRCNPETGNLDEVVIDVTNRSQVQK